MPKSPQGAQGRKGLEIHACGGTDKTGNPPEAAKSLEAGEFMLFFRICYYKQS
jgi:hypothetical protein